MIDMPEFHIRSICISRALGGKKVSSTAKALTAVGDGWTADICKQVEKLSARVGIGVTAEGTSVLL
jgi:hypothetical protein